MENTKLNSSSKLPLYWYFTVYTYLQNYENMFYSYYFDTGPLSKKRFEARFKTGAGKNPITSEEERWLGMSFNSMFDGKGMQTHGRPNLNVVIGT